MVRNIRVLEASYDELTGLTSPIVLEGIVNHVLHRAHRDGDYVSLLSIDVAGMGEINDRFSREYGDSLLVELGDLLIRELRRSDVVSRVGGDEFGVLLPQTDARQAAVVMEHLVASALVGNDDGSRPYTLSLQMGASTAYPTAEETTFSQMLDKARDNITVAKQGTSGSSPN